MTKTKQTNSVNRDMNKKDYANAVPKYSQNEVDFMIEKIKQRIIEKMEECRSWNGPKIDDVIDMVKDL